MFLSESSCLRWVLLYNPDSFFSRWRVYHLFLGSGINSVSTMQVLLLETVTGHSSTWSAESVPCKSLPISLMKRSKKDPVKEKHHQRLLDTQHRLCQETHNKKTAKSTYWLPEVCQLLVELQRWLYSWFQSSRWELSYLAIKITRSSLIASIFVSIVLY